MPSFSGLVRILAQIGAVIGCIMGTITVFGGFAAFRIGFMVGVTTISGGAFMILGSLGALGVTYCFLAITQASIETRNAIVEMAAQKSAG